MTQEQKIIRAKVGLLELAKQLGKVRKRPLLNLSDWPRERVAGLRMLLKGGTVVPKDQDAITIRRALPHGHVAAASAPRARSGSTACSAPRATAAAT
jgi:hypothetical protein